MRPNGLSSRTYTQQRPVSVLPLARTGTVVSSPCRRSAAMTCPSTSLSSGSSAAQRDPTASAMVDRLIVTPRHRPAMATQSVRVATTEGLTNSKENET